VHAVLEGTVDLIVANAYKIKHTPGRKTDVSDSEWIAELCLNGMNEPSRIFPKDDRELRRLTRAREGYVKQMTRKRIRSTNLSTLHVSSWPQLFLIYSENPGCIS